MIEITFEGMEETGLTTNEIISSGSTGTTGGTIEITEYPSAGFKKLEASDGYLLTSWKTTDSILSYSSSKVERVTMDINVNATYSLISLEDDATKQEEKRRAMEDMINA